MQAQGQTRRQRQVLATPGIATSWDRISPSPTRTIVAQRRVRIGRRRRLERTRPRHREPRTPMNITVSRAGTMRDGVQTANYISPDVKPVRRRNHGLVRFLQSRLIRQVRSHTTSSCAGALPNSSRLLDPITTHQRSNRASSQSTPSTPRRARSSLLQFSRILAGKRLPNRADFGETAPARRLMHSFTLRLTDGRRK